MPDSRTGDRQALAKRDLRLAECLSRNACFGAGRKDKGIYTVWPRPKTERNVLHIIRFYGRRGPEVLRAQDMEGAAAIKYRGRTFPSRATDESSIRHDFFELLDQLQRIRLGELGVSMDGFALVAQFIRNQ